MSVLSGMIRSKLASQLKLLASNHHISGKALSPSHAAIVHNAV